MATVNPSRLGARQVDVLRAAAAGRLARFDGGTWVAGSQACTRPAESVARLGLLADGRRTARVTLGAGTDHGHEVVLSSLGEVILAAYNAAHPGEVAALARRAEMIRRLAGQRGPVTTEDVLHLAATDKTLPDGAFTALADTIGDEHQ